MPIYAYRCTNCGFEKDFLQKMSDKPLTKCPQCGKDALVKELSAPGFELRGTGWAATDFNGGHKALPASHRKLEVSSAPTPPVKTIKGRMSRTVSPRQRPLCVFM